MHIFLDHINALLVSAVLVTIFVLLQVRGTQSNTEAAVNHMVRSETLDIAEMLERDLLNMRTIQQTTVAAAGGLLNGGTAFSCTTAVSVGVPSDTTTILQFPTLLDPQSAAGLPNPDLAEVLIVSYQLIRESGQSISRYVGPDTLVHPLYRLERQVGGIARGWSQSTITYFNVEFGRRSGVFTPATSAVCPTGDMNKVRFQIQMARDGVEDVANDQRNRNQLNFSRYGATVDLINWDL